MNSIILFVMNGCQICPQMELLFKKMHLDGEFDELEIIDVHQSPEKASLYAIRTVPFYLINNFSFTGLRSRRDIQQILKQSDSEKWQELIKTELSEGRLEPVENLLIQQSSARDAMLLLLQNIDTPLVVRIGLTAIIETIASSEILAGNENNFIELLSHPDERIAIDAIYYLSLLSTVSSIKKLAEIAADPMHHLQQHAREMLEEISSDHQGS